MPSTIANPTVKEPESRRNGTGNAPDPPDPPKGAASKAALALSAAALLCFALLALGLYTGVAPPRSKHEKELKHRIEILERQAEAQAKTISGMEARLAEAENRKTPLPDSRSVEGRIPGAENPSGKTIDPTVAWLQEIGYGFLVGHLTLEPTGEGVRVKGKIVNSTCLDHHNAHFRLAVNDRMQEILIPDLPAGGSANFEATIPGAAMENARPLKLQYLESSVAYNTR